MPDLPLFYGKPIDTPTGHKWAGYTPPLHADAHWEVQDADGNPLLEPFEDRHEAVGAAEGLQADGIQDAQVAYVGVLDYNLDDDDYDDDL